MYTEWELLEYSAVPIPCSPESLTMAYEKGVIGEALRGSFDAPAVEPEVEVPDVEGKDEELPESVTVSPLFSNTSLVAVSAAAPAPLPIVNVALVATT